MTPPRLLIADDEKNISEGLRMILEDEGYETETATDGESAWELVKSGDFGLVLADLRMPGLPTVWCRGWAWPSRTTRWAVTTRQRTICSISAGATRRALS
jgi:DNA-binding response OmpR family regulator